MLMNQSWRTIRLKLPEDAAGDLSVPSGSLPVILSCNVRLSYGEAEFDEAHMTRSPEAEFHQADRNIMKYMESPSLAFIRGKMLVRKMRGLRDVDGNCVGGRKPQL